MSTAHHTDVNTSISISRYNQIKQKVKREFRKLYAQLLAESLLIVVGQNENLWKFVINWPNYEQKPSCPFVYIDKMFVLPLLDITFSNESAQDRTTSFGILQTMQTSSCPSYCCCSAANKKTNIT